MPPNGMVEGLTVNWEMMSADAVIARVVVADVDWLLGSVTVTCTVKFPAAVGVQENEALFELVHPAGRLV